MKDCQGVEIKAGHTLMWKEHHTGCTNVGLVQHDAKYTDGLKCGGRSVRNIIEESDWVKVV